LEHKLVDINSDINSMEKVCVTGTVSCFKGYTSICSIY